MKRPIAMRCNREQFNSVRGKIPKGRIKNLWDFDSYDCVTNIYDDVDGISNIVYSDGEYKGLVIHETWNEETFLNACGIETERIFKGSELQYRKYRGCWIDIDVYDFYEYRFKPANLIKKQELESQILELQNQLKQL